MLLGIQYPLNSPVIFTGIVTTFDPILQMFLVRGSISPETLCLLRQGSKRDGLIAVLTRLFVEPFAHFQCPFKVHLTRLGNIKIHI